MVNKRRPTDGTEPLFVETGSTGIGPMQRAVLDVLELARAGDKPTLVDLDAGLAQLAVEAARAVDLAIGSRDPYAFSQPARELRELLAQLKLDPASRGGAASRDPFEDFLADLGDDGTAAPVRDPQDSRPT